MKNKGSSLYKIITTLTLALPLPIYMFLSATLFSIKPDYRIDNALLSDLSIVVEQDNMYITSNNLSVMYEGLVVYITGQDKYGLVVDNDDIIKIDDGYYSCILNEQGVFELKDIKEFTIQKTQQYNLPIAFFISVLAVLIVFLIVQGKMKWHKKYPRVAVMVALVTGTVVLYLIDTIVGSMLNVFMVATVSWGGYLVEYLVAQGKMNDLTANKVEADLTTALKNALKGGN